MEINGKKVNLVLDMGVIRLLKKEHGINIMALSKEEEKDPDVLATTILVIANRGGSGLTMDDIDSLSIAKLKKIEKMIASEAREEAEEAGPLAENRRS